MFTWNATELVGYLRKQFAEIKLELLIIKTEIEKIKEELYEKKDN